MHCKTRRPKKCEQGDHEFTVSEWRIAANGTSQKANAWTCIHCLHAIEGDYSVKQIRGTLHPIQVGQTDAHGADTKDS